MWASSEHAWETLSTLRFASRMKCIENTPVRNSLVPKEASSSTRPLLNQIEALKRELAIRDAISGRVEPYFAELSRSQTAKAARAVLRYAGSGRSAADVSIDGVPQSREQAAVPQAAQPPEIHSLSEARFMLAVMKDLLLEACNNDASGLREVVKSYGAQKFPDLARVESNQKGTPASPGAFDKTASGHKLKKKLQSKDVEPISAGAAKSNVIESAGGVNEIHRVEPTQVEGVEVNGVKAILTFEEFKGSEGKAIQDNYEEVKQALKSSKERQKQLVRVINQQKSIIDSLNETISQFKQEQELRLVSSALPDVLEVRSTVSEQEYAKSLVDIESAKKVYREAHAELVLCKKEIEELQELKKTALASVVSAYDAYCSS